MRRVVKVQKPMGEAKYVLRQEYNGFGIYQENANGYRVHQSWLLRKDDSVGSHEKFDVMIQSYNDVCYEELLDMIDNYDENGELGIKVLDSKSNENVLIMHPSGDFV